MGSSIVGAANIVGNDGFRNVVIGWRARILRGIHLTPCLTLRVEMKEYFKRLRAGLLCYPFAKSQALLVGWRWSQERLAVDELPFRLRCLVSNTMLDISVFYVFLLFFSPSVSCSCIKICVYQTHVSKMLPCTISCIIFLIHIVSCIKNVVKFWYILQYVSFFRYTNTRVSKISVYHFFWYISPIFSIHHCRVPKIWSIFWYRNPDFDTQQFGDHLPSNWQIEYKLISTRLYPCNGRNFSTMSCTMNCPSNYLRGGGDCEGIPRHNKVETPDENPH